MYTSIDRFRSAVNEDGAAYATPAGTPGMGAMADLGNGTFSDTAVKLDGSVSMPVMPKFLKKRKKKDYTKTGNAVRENSTTDEHKTKLFAFIDYPWQEDVEIEVIGLLDQYRQKFVEGTAENIQSYLRRLMTANDFESSVFVRSTESFATEYRALAGVS